MSNSNARRPAVIDCEPSPHPLAFNQFMPGARIVIRQSIVLTELSPSIDAGALHPVVLCLGTCRHLPSSDQAVHLDKWQLTKELSTGLVVTIAGILTQLAEVFKSMQQNIQ